MTFFITGGAGFLGINYARYVLARGHSVVSYDLAPFDYPEKDRVRAVVGDIRDFDALKRAMQGSDVVVHTAAALPLYTPEDIRSTDIDGTRNVLRAAKELKIERVVHVSSTAVYGIPDHHPLKESDKLDGVGEYGKAKIAAEELCKKARQEGLCVPVLRPKSFIGPERLGVFALFYDWAADGSSFPMIGSGNNRYQLLDVEDLCDALYLCATLPRAQVNDTFNIGAKEFATMREDYQAVLDKAGFGKKVVGTPATLIVWILRLLEALNLSPLYKWVYETAAKDSFVSIEKAERVLGYKPQYSNKDALLRNYEWYLAHRDHFKNASGVSHRVPWKQGLLGLAKPLFRVMPDLSGWASMRAGVVPQSYLALIIFVLGLFVGAVLTLQVLYPYAYLAADSFTYFATARHFAESGLLLSYNGVDHTTGVHLGWYLLLLPFYPLFGMELPQGVFVVGLALILGGLWFIWRSFGAITAVIMLLISMTTWGVFTINSGMESSLVFFALCAFTQAAVCYGPRLLAPPTVAVWRAAAILGALAGFVAFARLDSAVLFAALGLVVGVGVLWSERTLAGLWHSTLYVLVPLSAGFLAVFVPTIAIMYAYSGSLMPIAGMIKSSFPHVVGLQDVATFRKFPLAVVLLGMHLILLYRRGALGVLFPTLFIATLVLYAYNFLFVVGVGVWYSALPLFAIALVLGVWVRDLWVPAVVRRHAGPVALLLVTVFVVGALTQHMRHPYVQSEHWMSAVPGAAAYLGTIAKEGEAAAEVHDGVFAFYSPIPVYSLTGLANNRAYYDAVIEGTLEEYFAERNVRYILGGTTHAPIPAHAGYEGGYETGKRCKDPFYTVGALGIFRVENCFD